MVELQNKKTGEIIVFPTPSNEPVDIKRFPWLGGDILNDEEINKWFLFHLNKKSKIPKSRFKK